MFSDEYGIRKKNFDSYNAGEGLFVVPHQSYPELVKTQSQIKLLDKLYNLYSKVKSTICKWKDITWIEIKNEIKNITDIIEVFIRDCARLPGVLKSWDAIRNSSKRLKI